MFTNVYRIEHPETHEGPYRHYAEGNGVRLALHRAHEDEAHPGPYEEGWDNILDDEIGLPRFGFVTVQQMLVWFEGFFGRMAEEGFIVSTYEVLSTAVISSPRQCVFDAECSNRIAETPIQEFIRSVDM